MTMTTEPCTCKPGDGTEQCPREEQCETDWLRRQEYRRKLRSIAFSRVPGGGRDR